MYRSKLLTIGTIAVSLFAFSGMFIAVNAQSVTTTCFVDLNKDLRVDLSDYSLLVGGLLKPIKDTNLDLSGDFQVDISDYAVFSGKFRDGFTSCQNTPTTYYISPSGNDNNSGTESQPFATIAKAVGLVKSSNLSSALIYLLPGTYRQRTDVIGLNGNPNTPIVIAAKQPGTVTISGGESSRSVTWVKSAGSLNFPSGVASHIYYADISVWNGAPQLATYTTNNNVSRLPIAREPDFDLYEPTADNRWTAEKNDPALLNTSLIATTANPAGTNVGNLQQINGFNTNFLVGGAAFIKDTYSAHDEDRVVITEHNASQGKIKFDQEITYYSGEPMVGPNSKYYVEGKPELLDTPGEWIYDPTQKRIYIWPLNDVSPANQDIEFAIRPVGIMVRNSKNIVIRGINFTAVNYQYSRNSNDEAAILISNKDANLTSENITIDKVKITHVGVGIRISQSTTQGKLTKNVRVQDSEVGYTDGVVLNTFHWPNRDSNNVIIPGIVGVYLYNNEFHHGGYRPAATMIWMQQTQNIVFRNNYIHDSPHNAVEIQGGADTNMLVMNNLFRHNCVNGSDCGGFKVWGALGNMHNVLIMNNVAESTVGCSYASKKAARYVSSKGEGCGGFGFYADVNHTSKAGDPAVVYFRNLAVDNNFSGFHNTRSDDHVYNQNIGLNNPAGFRANIGTVDTEKLKTSKIIGNLWINNNDAPLKTATMFGTPSPLYDVGFSLAIDEADRANVAVDRNAYAASGQSSRRFHVRPINSISQQKFYNTISDIRNNTPWEDNGGEINVPATLPSANGFDITSYLQAANISMTPISEVTSTLTRLQTALGIPISLETWVGRK